MKRITNEQEREAAYSRIQLIEYGRQMDAKMGPDIHRPNPELDELCGAIEQYELQNGHICPDCKAPEIRQPHCLNCSGMDVEDFV